MGSRGDDEFLVGIVEADSEREAAAVEAVRHDELRGSYATRFVSLEVTGSRVLERKAGPELRLDAGRVLEFEHGGQSWRAVLPPARPFMEQVITHLEQIPASQSRPSLMLQDRGGQTRLSRGSYFALIVESCHYSAERNDVPDKPRKERSRRAP